MDMTEQPEDPIAWKKTEWYQDYVLAYRARQVAFYMSDSSATEPLVERDATVDELLAFLKFARNHPEFWPLFVELVREGQRDKKNVEFEYCLTSFCNWYTMINDPTIDDGSFFAARWLLAKHVLNPETPLEGEFAERVLSQDPSLEDKPEDPRAWTKASWYQEYVATHEARQSAKKARLNMTPPIFDRNGTVAEMLAYMTYARNHPEFWPRFVYLVQEAQADEEDKRYSHYAGDFSRWYCMKRDLPIGWSSFYKPNSLLIRQILLPETTEGFGDARRILEEDGSISS
jgi:hypothetical protein